MSGMRILLVQANDNDGENQDQFVAAPNAADAIDAYLAHTRITEIGVKRADIAAVHDIAASDSIKTQVLEWGTDISRIYG